jgi:magnesium chelatase subunit D
MQTLPETKSAAPETVTAHEYTLELSALAPENQCMVLLALDGHQLGGALLDSTDIDAASTWVTRLTALRLACNQLTEPQRLPLNCGYEQLTGGIDVMNTLLQGQPMHYHSVLSRADQSLLILPSPERQPAENLHALCQALDSGQINGTPARVCVIANVHEEEAGNVSLALIDRLAFCVMPVHASAIHGDTLLNDKLLDDRNLDAQLFDDTLFDAQMAAGFALDVEHCSRVVRAALHRSAQLTVEQVQAVCLAARDHGIDSMRATLQCARVARASATLAGRTTANDVDIGVAMNLCLAWRAASIQPQQLEDNANPDNQAEPDSVTDDSNDAQKDPTQTETDSVDDVDQHARSTEQQPEPEQESMLVTLPEKLLSAIANTQRNAFSRQQAGGRTGRQVHKAQRGRLVGIDRYRAGSGQRINMLATLREATPWQSQRQREQALTRPIIYPQDLRASRYKQAAHTVVVFAVDASGSAAAHRLAEAKGAVERLLTECYERRDQVALVVFQGAQATLVLPPTRSLVRARRELARFPSGGGTPLPSALELVKELGVGIRKAGHTPMLCLLTDGRANVDRDGIGGRARASQQSIASAQALRAMGMQSLVIDIATRVTPLAGKLAAAMGGQYLALPKANAASISAAVLAAKSATTDAAIAS